MLGSAQDLLARVVLLSVTEQDDDEQRVRKSVAVLLAVIVTVLAPIWSVTYLLVDRPVSAAMPGSYSVISAGLLLWMTRRRRAVPGFPELQLIFFAALPVLLQASMGGFVHGSVVAIWAFAAPVLALVVYGTRAAAWWFGVFAASIVVSALLEPALSDAVEAPPRAMQLTFFALDVAFPLLTVLFVLAYFVRQRDAANARTGELLAQILPETVIIRMKRGEEQIADRHEEATVLFADIVGFTAFADSVAPERIVSLLSRAFVELDRLTTVHGLEKIKTLGDGYLAVAGVTSPRPDHAAAATAMALEIEPALIAALGDDWPDLRMRVGMATGPVMAGVIGSERFSFDTWGDTVNTASRMSSYAEPGGVLVTEETCAAVHDLYHVERREAIEVKGKGPMTTYVVLGPRMDEAAVARSSVEESTAGGGSSRSR
jgi:adenylate cyclase